MDLPKVAKWLSRENDCGKKVSNKDWCNTGNKAYVWELVAYKAVLDLGDWAYAEAPFTFMQAFSHDGIVCTEQGDKNKLYRCTKYESFQPVNYSDFQAFDFFTENQWATEERTVGPKNIIRPIINKSTDYVPTFDAEGRGIVCFYDKLWVGNYIRYLMDDPKQKYQNVQFYFEFVFQPVSMERNDYWQHLLDRNKCSSRCDKETVLPLPCIGPCYFKDARDYKDDEKVIVPGRYADLTSGNIGKRPDDIEVTGAQLKKIELDPKPCWYVCEVGGGGDCKECQKKLTECTMEKESLENQIKICKKDIERLYSQVQMLNEKNGELTKDLRDCGNELRQTKTYLETALNAVQRYKKQAEDCAAELQKCKDNCKVDEQYLSDYVYKWSIDRMENLMTRCRQNNIPGTEALILLMQGEYSFFRGLGTRFTADMDALKARLKFIYNDNIDAVARGGSFFVMWFYMFTIMNDAFSATPDRLQIFNPDHCLDRFRNTAKYFDNTITDITFTDGYLLKLLQKSSSSGSEAKEEESQSQESQSQDDYPPSSQAQSQGKDQEVPVLSKDGNSEKEKDSGAFTGTLDEDVPQSQMEY